MGGGGGVVMVKVGVSQEIAPLIYHNAKEAASITKQNLVEKRRAECGSACLTVFNRVISKALLPMCKPFGRCGSNGEQDPDASRRKTNEQNDKCTKLNRFDTYP